MAARRPLTSGDTSAVPSVSETGERAWKAQLAPLRGEPGRSAVLTDVDGTLAPIVERAEDAAVPARARELLARLSESYALVGCISGRQATDARRLVGLEALYYAGNHGLELLLPGDEEPRPDASLAGREHDAAEFLTGLDPERLAAAELRREDKGPIQALHWRGAAEEASAEGRAHEIAREAGQAGLEPRWGRKVLELRPVGGGGKDNAVASLLAGDGFEMAVYAGDDRTDLDAFRRLRELREGGELTAAVCVGVVSPEAPMELAEEADLIVEGPEGWLRILEWLAEPAAE
jgi:trehalose 6-phosphate phosphatase